MDEAETKLGKPILLEEFGKRLVKGSDAQLFSDAIDRLRNPVFQTTYSVINAAIQACAPQRPAQPSTGQPAAILSSGGLQQDGCVR